MWHSHPWPELEDDDDEGHDVADESEGGDDRQSEVYAVVELQHTKSQVIVLTCKVSEDPPTIWKVQS